MFSLRPESPRTAGAKVECCQSGESWRTRSLPVRGDAGLRELLRRQIQLRIQVSHQLEHSSLGVEFTMTPQRSAWITGTLFYSGDVSDPAKSTVSKSLTRPLALGNGVWEEMFFDSRRTAPVYGGSLPETLVRTDSNWPRYATQRLKGRIIVADECDTRGPRAATGLDRVFAIPVGRVDPLSTG